MPCKPIEMKVYASSVTDCSSQGSYRDCLTKGFYPTRFLFLIYASAACLLSNSYA